MNPFPAGNFLAIISSPFTNVRMKSIGGLFLTLLFSIAAVAAEPNPRADFLKLVQRPRVSLKAQVEQLASTNGLAQFHFSFARDWRQQTEHARALPQTG
jgi:hypothetical protein